MIAFRQKEVDRLKPYPKADIPRVSYLELRFQLVAAKRTFPTLI